MMASGPGVDVGLFLQDTKRSCSLSSGIPELTRTEECFMGIDEAGRGPVLGPMVYGTCFCPVSRREEVSSLGFADSKTLTEESREALFETINGHPDLFGWKAEILSPNDISNSMLQRCKYNLNALSHDTAIGLIGKVLSDGVNVTEVYVDTVGVPEKYQSKLQERFPQLKITVSKKADSLFPIVSAASICAKVIRDACVKRWLFTERGLDLNGCELGSGYPADPTTKKWLQESLDPVFGYPTIARFSWSTCQDILDKKALEVKWPDDEVAESYGSAKISQFFEPKKPKNKKHRFFEERGLSTVSDF